MEDKSVCATLSRDYGMKDYRLAQFILNYV